MKHSLRMNDQIYMAAKNFVESVGSGNVKVIVKMNRHGTKSIKIEDTLYVPKLRNNLLSVSNITDKSYSVVFFRNCAIIKAKNGNIVLSVTRQDQLYITDEKINQAMIGRNESDKNLLIWHQRYRQTLMILKE